MQTDYFTTADGVKIAYHTKGEGRPLLLIHGYFSNAQTNWIKYGHADLLIEAGFKLIMPDLRAHGFSDKPHDPSAYPADILVDDQLELIKHLQLSDYDLCGYSLGGRIVMCMLAQGIKPRKAIISGMGLDGILNSGRRAEFFRHVLDHLGEHPRGSSAYFAEAFLKTTAGDPLALKLILNTFTDTPEAVVKQIQTATAVICGVEDQDNGHAQELAHALPNGQYIPIPGNHMSAVAKKELGIAIRDYLCV